MVEAFTMFFIATILVLVIIGIFLYLIKNVGEDDKQD
jgi:hypothetical protein